MVNKHTLKNFFKKKQKNDFESEQIQSTRFLYDQEILKNPIVSRPIVAGYNCILSPALIFVGHYLKEFCVKFDYILMDSLSLVKILEKETFDSDDFLFTVDFESLYTLNLQSIL